MRTSAPLLDVVRMLEASELDQLTMRSTQDLFRVVRRPRDAGDRFRAFVEIARFLRRPAKDRRTVMLQECSRDLEIALAAAGRATVPDDVSVGVVRQRLRATTRAERIFEIARLTM
jgi:hypothetical protein